MKKNPSRNVHFSKGPSNLLDEINASIDIDQRLYKEDIEGSIAHAEMLGKQKIISKKDQTQIVSGLKSIKKDIENNKVIFSRELEDIHMNIESLLFKKIGKVAGKLHTARSRNDQVVTDLKLWIRNNSKEIDSHLKLFQKTLINISKKNIETVMPGYTHLQVAQPITLAHHMLAYVEMIGRDRSRLNDCLYRLNENPLGSAALAGTSFPIDRNYTSKKLGFREPTKNAMDSVSDRDFAVEFMFVLSLVSVHLSRIAEEIVLWSNQQFNFIILPDELSTGSSIMPQKKNPDGAELVRGKTNLIFGNLNSILNILKGLPLSYSKDLQDDKALVFNSFDNLTLCLKVINEILSKSHFNKVRMKEVIDNSNSTATDLANWLVQSLNYTFRDAYKITGKVVSYCVKKNKKLETLSLQELQQFDKKITLEAKNVLSSIKSISAKSSFGGTSPNNAKKMIKFAIKKYLK
ncbi:argininosuccinate lyase [Pelagibacteraceae bacterium]|nr:argininosuccinate lyase [Pelagibacteraceae bacterium]|tara:strand:+ start:2565 stop:3950 length:1386 start_codon:yes stop_codon:yes gene_type:complete